MLSVIKADEFNAKPSAGGRITLKIPTKQPFLLDAITLRGVGYTNLNTELLLSSVINRVVIKQDTFDKCIIDPALQRKLDDFYNANADTLALSQMLVPFNRYLNPNTGWGVGDIGQLVLEVQCKDTFPVNTTFTDLKALIAVHPIDAPVPRGNVFVQTVIPVQDVVGGWNQINDLQYYGVIAITKLLFDAANVTQVEIYLNDRIVYQKQKNEALFHLQVNPIYKIPSTCTYTEVAGQAVTSTGPFPVVLDDFGLTGDSMGIFDANGRMRVKIRYYVDTNVAAAASFNILAEGIERGAQANAPVAAGRA